LAAASIITVGISVINKIFGYIREAVIAGYFGTSAIFDIFILAFTIPEIVASIIMMALPAALIPSLRDQPPGERKDKSGFFWQGAIILTPIFAALSMAIFLFRKELFLFFASDYSTADQNLGPRLLAISSGIVFFRGMESYFRSWMFEKKHFIVPYTSNLILDICILVSIFILFGRLGIESLAYGWLIASVVLFIYNFVFAFIMVKPPSKIDFAWSWGGKILKLMAAVSLIELASMSFPLVDRFIAARVLAEGQISALRYAANLISIPVIIFIVSFGTASFPWISDLSNESGVERLRKLYSESIGLIVFVMLAVSIGVAIFANDIVKIAFNRGAFDEMSIMLTSGPLAIYALGVVFYSVYGFQMRIYYAKMNYKRLGTILFAMMLIKIFTSLILVRPLGHNGLALSTSITWLVGFIIMTSDLGKSMQFPVSKFVSRPYAKIIGVAVIMGIFWLITSFVWSSSGQSLVVTFLYLSLIAIVGLALYVILAAKMGISEFRKILGYLPSRFKFGRGADDTIS